jgi:hypothetical protein
MLFLRLAVPKVTLRSTAIDCRTLRPLPSSGTDATVQELAEALRGELRSTYALEQSAITEYIEVECQRLRLRLMRDQIEGSYALGHVWRLLSNSMMQESTARWKVKMIRNDLPSWVVNLFSLHGCFS